MSSLHGLSAQYQSDDQEAPGKASPYTPVALAPEPSVGAALRGAVGHATIVAWGAISIVHPESVADRSYIAGIRLSSTATFARSRST
jgi:hypothetical protein